MQLLALAQAPLCRRGVPRAARRAAATATPMLDGAKQSSGMSLKAGNLAVATVVAGTRTALICWLLVAGCWLLVAGCWVIGANSWKSTGFLILGPWVRIPPGTPICAIGYLLTLLASNHTSNPIAITHGRVFWTCFVGPSCRGRLVGRQVRRDNCSSIRSGHAACVAWTTRRNLAKVGVEGSNPFARSSFSQ
jgi:hypothetical protein